MPRNVELDSVDRFILAAIQRDPRTSNKDLASQIGIAQSTCLDRMRSLSERGVIRRHLVELDPETMGRGTKALIQIRVRVHSRSVVEDFWTYLMELPQTVQVFHVSGAADFLVHVAVPSADDLRDFLLDALTSRAEVAHLETHIVFSHARRSVLEILE